VAENRIVAEARNEFGKGAARRIRRDHKVPAVLYGHGQPPVHLTLPGHETQLALRQQNVLLTIQVNGTDELALPKQVQRNPIRGDLEHVDLILVRRGEKVHVDITVHVTGDAAPDSLVVLELSSVGVTAEATRIPESFEVSVEGLQPGTQLHARDLRLPDGVDLAVDPDLLIINITAATTAEQLEAELDEAQAELGIEAAPEAVEETEEGAGDDGAAPADGDTDSSDRAASDSSEGSDDRS
jgi:large subunit ribosomal protein L25